MIASACIDVLDRSCVDECPVDCIYEGDRKLYINPHECIDCGLCESVCPVNAIAPDSRLSQEEWRFAEEEFLFFYERLPGRDAPIGDPEGAMTVGRVGVDTPFVASFSRPSTGGG